MNNDMDLVVELINNTSEAYDKVVSRNNKVLIGFCVFQVLLLIVLTVFFVGL